MLRALLIVALVLMALTSAKPLTSSVCTVVATRCDNEWHSNLNQTFAFWAIAPPNMVQILSYWGNTHGCLGDLVTANSNMTMSLPTCSSITSRWTYGPGAIQTYVQYNNTENDCLSLHPNPTAPEHPTLGLAKCCKNNCTAVELDMQMWLEPDTSKNPYSRIFSKYEYNGAAYCLTRIGDSC